MSFVSFMSPGSRCECADVWTPTCPSPFCQAYGAQRLEERRALRTAQERSVARREALLELLAREEEEARLLTAEAARAERYAAADDWLESQRPSP